MRLAIDWDNTIQDRKNPVTGKRFGPPLLGAQEAIEELAERGLEIVIHSCTATEPSGVRLIEEWMEAYDIPFSAVTAIKPEADLYIDDKGLHFTNWDRTLPEIYGRLGIERD